MEYRKLMAGEEARCSNCRRPLRPGETDLCRDCALGIIPDDSYYTNYSEFYRSGNKTKASVLKQGLKPSEKDPELDAQITEMTGIDRRKAIETNTCPFCGKQYDPDTEFKDEASMREAQISGLCQKCQDDTFGTSDI